ncbi:MAG: hypothetical protein R6X10_10440 [Desulfobacterales bacterium]
MSKINISKLKAARAQLDAAIEMYFVSDNPVATHTLTSAAYNILRDIALKSGSDCPFLKTGYINEYPESKRKMIRNFLNRPENFFKHADRDPNGTIEFDTELTELFLLDACAYFRDKKELRPKYYNIFKAWHGVPKKRTSNTQKLFVETMRDYFRSKGKLEYWRCVTQHLPKNKAD